MIKKSVRYMADFETTVYDDQSFTEVWAAAIVELETEDVKLFGNIWDFMNHCFELARYNNVIIYFHNLKFDVSFILSYLITEINMPMAIEYKGPREHDVRFKADKNMDNNTFKYLCSSLGQWYTLIIKKHNHMIAFQDSLKLLPFSVERIGKAFGTKHQKLTMEYKGFRYANCPISKKEEEYIKNDVLVVKEALEIMFRQGHRNMTIGSCCLQDFKRTQDKEEYNYKFLQLDALQMDRELFGSDNVDQYIRNSYRGGWCYVKKGKEDTILTDGLTLDVNSLYPSMMHSMSGNYFPVGYPHFWRGNYIDKKALLPERYYFIRFRCRFYLKPEYLPFIQIKNSFMYKSTECLETSDVLGNDGKFYRWYMVGDKKKDTAKVLTMTMTDFELFREHYILKDLEILDGCWFYAEKGIFDEYLNKWKELKMNSTGAIRELAKLFQNNLYGKMAASSNSSFKYAYEKEDGSIGFLPVEEHDKKVGYIPIGSAITSYARNFTIRAAQKNYDRFVYADTDSLHLTCKPDEVNGCPVHPSEYCHWKLETQWDKAIFVRQKTYIEHVTHDGLEPIKAYYNIKCAGMPKKCKDYLQRSFDGEKGKKGEPKEVIDFLKKKRDMQDFKRGLIVPGKLIAKRIRGGIILKETTFEMR